MKTYTHFGTRQTPQNAPIPGTSQVANNAGGFAWEVDDWVKLDRFLVLGSEGGTYYVKERELTKDNAEAAMRCIMADGKRVVERVVEISHGGRAPKNDPALFVLAMAAGIGDQRTRNAALSALPQVARIGTHLFHFLTYVQQFRGWGRLLREGVSRWYTEKEVDALAYQVVKYRQRDGWTHRDVLRKAHPESAAHNDIFHWITQGELRPLLVGTIVDAFERVQGATSAHEVARLISYYNLPREAIPTQFLNEAVVWEALLERMPMTAMIRNLGKMTSVGLLKPMSAHAAKVVEVLGEEERLRAARVHPRERRVYVRRWSRLRAARVHPLSVLVALKTYEQGHGERGSLKWEPVAQIVDALDSAFYTSFGSVEPSGKRIMLALDVSGSMGSPAISGMPGITPAVGSAAMALVTANVEKNYMTTVFSDSGEGRVYEGSISSRSGISAISLSPRQRLDDVIRKFRQLPFYGTDCALPMLYASEHNLEIDAFIIYTDSETWAGGIHPSQALAQYREKTGIPAKLVVVGMVSNSFSIADPNDGGMLDVVGFDTATPNVISNFVSGK